MQRFESRPQEQDLARKEKAAIGAMDLGDQLERYRKDAKELLGEPRLRAQAERVAAHKDFDLEDVREEGRLLVGTNGEYPVDAFVMAVILLREHSKQTLH